MGWWGRFKGFVQVYSLQTQNDEAETWKDLVRPVYHLSRDEIENQSNVLQAKHGFDRNLRLKSQAS